MLFYCPNCRSEVDAKPQSTITTKMNRIAYKAACPTCGQDMAEFAPAPTQAEATLISTPPPVTPSPEPSPSATPSTIAPAAADATVTAYLSSEPNFNQANSTSSPLEPMQEVASDPNLVNAQTTLNQAAQAVGPVTNSIKTTDSTITPDPDNLTEFSINPAPVKISN